MTTLLLISDNHLDKHVMVKILKREKYDLSIHLGDSQMSEKDIANLFNYYVGGNNDHNFSREELIIEVENQTIALCHGHTLNVHFLQPSAMQRALVAFAHKMKAKIVFFGHTHVPTSEHVQNITLINPGSVTWPRQGSNKSYCLVTLDKGKIIAIKFKKV